MTIEHYDPEKTGKKIFSNRGNIRIIRKHHLNEKQFEKAKKDFQETTKDVPPYIKDKAGSLFFNPFRKRGIYYAQIQSLYLLGANEWHEYFSVISKMKEFAEQIVLQRTRNGVSYSTTVWKEFERKVAKEGAKNSKDIFGRFNENMHLLQRLNKLNPYGYKLKQVGAAIDIKREPKEGFPKGVLFYRLSTYNSPEKAIPLKENAPCLS